MQNHVNLGGSGKRPKGRGTSLEAIRESLPNDGSRGFPVISSHASP